MKIIAYNSSHETSICQYDTETKKIDFLYEEERFRRVKYWTPSDKEGQLLCIERKKIETPDHLIGCSFDRRRWVWQFNKDEIEFQKIIQRRLLDELSKEQLSSQRIKELVLQEKPYFYEPNKILEIIDTGIESNDPHVPNTHPMHTQCDDVLIGQVADQLDLEEFHYEIQHHMYHAECGYWFSPWREKENAIAIVMDGGGCQPYFNEYPNYQEVETIYKLQPDTVPVKQYQRLSNYRNLSEMNGMFFWENDMGHIHRAPDLEIEKDGSQIVFSSKPSMGMNFSSLSLYLGFDKLGRAAGKVMGAASYQEWTESPEGYTDWSTHSMCNLLQQKSFDYTCGVIQRAIDLNPDCKNIILSGGFALNCTNNAKYLERFPDHQFFVDPVAHDGGTAVGGAIRLARALKHGETTV